MILNVAYKHSWNKVWYWTECNMSSENSVQNVLTEMPCRVTKHDDGQNSFDIPPLEVTQGYKFTKNSKFSYYTRYNHVPTCRCNRIQPWTELRNIFLPTQEIMSPLHSRLRVFHCRGHSRQEDQQSNCTGKLFSTFSACTDELHVGCRQNSDITTWRH